MNDQSQPYEVCIVLGGALAANVSQIIARSEYVVAADGAARTMMQQQLSMHAVVGDFDSLSPADIDQLTQRNIALHSSADQDTTDFEKCLQFCVAQNLRRAVVVGFEGGDIDHLIGNWSAIHQYAHELSLDIVTASQMMTIGKGVLRLSTEVGNVVSIIPHTYARVSSEGLEWPLDRMELTFGQRLGTRNKALSDQVAITIHSGVASVVFPLGGNHHWSANE